MRRCMGRVPRMTISPMAYPDITMTDKYANPVDETGKKLDVPQSLVCIGEGGICFFRCTGSLRLHLPPLHSRLPDGILCLCSLPSGAS
jgi:hypothetical protein